MINLVIIQAVIYFVTFVFGFFIAVPVGVTQLNFGGNCILYGDVIFDAADVRYFKYSFGLDSNCNYCIYLVVLLSLLYAPGIGVLHIFFILKTEEQLPQSPFVRLVFVIINSVIAFLMLVQASVLSSGFSQWCSGILSGKEIHGIPFNSCADGQFMTWRKHYGGTFHTCLVMAEVFAWLTLLLWVAQIVLSVFRMRQGENPCPNFKPKLPTLKRNNAETKY